MWGDWKDIRWERERWTNAALLENIRVCIIQCHNGTVY